MTNILLVDDNDIQAMTRKAVLSRSGKQVMVANSAPVALEMLGDPGFSSQLSLVITDHIMPGMHGPEFVQNLRAVLPTVPVLVLSGLPDAMDAYEGLDIVFRLKPLAPEELIRLANELPQTAMGRTA
ncbi:response regulator [Acidobacterium sp.]|nr:response regulator [Acidobacterium sp.]HCT60630.1 response regulator [Acidobacterium sp.]